MQRFPGCDGVGGSELARCSSPRWSGYETDPLLVTRAPLFLLPWGCESMMSTTTQPRQGAAPGEPAAGGGGLHGRSPWRPRSLCAGHGVCTCVPVCAWGKPSVAPWSCLETWKLKVEEGDMCDVSKPRTSWADPGPRRIWGPPWPEAASLASRDRSPACVLSLPAAALQL